jgi:hypothetical protein
MSRPSFVWQTGSWSETHPDLQYGQGIWCSVNGASGRRNCTATGESGTGGTGVAVIAGGNVDA